MSATVTYRYRCPVTLSRRDLALIADTRRRLADGSARRDRLAAGVKVIEIAAVLDVEPSAVTQWERGKRSPTAAHALAYAKTLAAASAPVTQ